MTRLYTVYAHGVDRQFMINLTTAAEVSDNDFKALCDHLYDRAMRESLVLHTGYPDTVNALARLVDILVAEFGFQHVAPHFYAREDIIFMDESFAQDRWYANVTRGLSESTIELIKKRIREVEAEE